MRYTAIQDQPGGMEAAAEEGSAAAGPEGLTRAVAVFAYRPHRRSAVVCGSATASAGAVAHLLCLSAAPRSPPWHSITVRVDRSTITYRTLKWVLRVGETAGLRRRRRCAR